MQRVLLFCTLIGAVSAQMSFISELPPCALNCIIQSLPSTNCSLTDLACMCTTDALWDQVYTCAQPICSTREALVAQRVANEACDAPVRDRSLQVAILGPVLAGISGLFVLMRIIARRRSGNTPSFGLGWDDCVLVAAWAFGVPKAIMDPFFYKYGLGRDVWTVPFHDIDRLLRLFYFGELFYLLSVSLTKIALLAFFLRVFVSQSSQRITWVMIGLVVAFTIAFVFPLIFQCSPINYAWLRWDDEREGKCINVFAAFISHGAVNMVLDIVILIMPLPQLYKLQINYSHRRKIQIFIMFGFGLIVTVFSIIRLNSLLAFIGSRNPTWDYWGAAIWSVVEMYVGVICACLPAAKVFFARMIPSLLTSVPTRNSTKLYSQSSARAAFSDAHEQEESSRVRSPESVQLWQVRTGSTPAGDEKPLRHVARVSLVSV